MCPAVIVLLLSSAVRRDGTARDALVQSKQRRYSAPHCSEALLARSYTLPPRWPWGAFHLVMEFTPNTCDLYAEGATSFCSGMAALNPPSGGSGDPESHVTEALASFLSHCARSSCRSLDLGANNGWMTGYMLSAGSHVLAVEPSKDFARAITETGRLNCGWADRLTVRNVRACVKGMPGQSRETCLAPSTCGRCSCGGWRWGNTQGAPQIEVAHGERCAERFGLPANVSGLAFEDLVWEAAAGTGEIDLIKMDADGPEGSWLKALSVMLHGDRPLRVRTIIVEASNVDPRTMHHFQNKLGAILRSGSTYTTLAVTSRVKGLMRTLRPAASNHLTACKSSTNRSIACAASTPRRARTAPLRTTCRGPSSRTSGLQSVRCATSSISARTPRFKAGLPSCSLCLNAATRCSTS